MDGQYSVETRSRFAALPIDGEEAPIIHAKVNSTTKSEKELNDKKIISKDDNQGYDNSGDSSRGRGARLNNRGTRGAPRGGGRGGRPENSTNGLNDFKPRGRGRGGRVNGLRMDRQSGSDRTGVKPTMKKDGYGTGNWGTVQDELDVTMNSDQQIENVEETDASEVNNIPPEPQVITFSEYKAARSKENKQEPNSIRKPNDGKDVFKNMIIKNPSVKKVQALEESKENIKHYEETEDTLTFECVNEIKTFDESRSYNQNNRNSRGGQRGRGGRATGRGRGFGENRGGRNNSNTTRAPVPSIKNADDFPALA